MHGVDDVMMCWMWMDFALGACFYLGACSLSRMNDRFEPYILLLYFLVISRLRVFVFTRTIVLCFQARRRYRIQSQ